jgi:hypothetical protein
MLDGPLSPAQIEAFHSQGYLKAPAMFSRDEMAEITRWTDDIATFPELPGKYMMYFETSQLDGSRILSRMENFYPYHQGFAALFDGDKLKQSTAQLFGEPVVLFKDKINFKLPGGDGFKPHQDVQAGWDRYGSLHISVLVCIDEANQQNGCLELVSGQHDKGLIGNMWTPLGDEQMAAMEFVSVPTLPGDVVFFDSFAPHGSGPNLTNQARRVLYVTYNKLSEGDHREQYYADKRLSYPPDCERAPEKTYVFRV